MLSFGSTAVFAGDPVIEWAGDGLVELDASTLEQDDLFWENTAPETMGDFVRIDQFGGELIESDGLPIIDTVAGVQAVVFNSTKVMDVFQALDATPEGLTGIDPTRSIEVWALNPQIGSEETLVSWGKRGGPDGSNMSFNYGTHGNFGAVGHWGGNGPDLGWVDNDFTAGAPAAGEWHHLVYTYDGATTRVYSDGCIVDENDCAQNSEELGAGVLNTYVDPRITLAAQIEGDGVTLQYSLRGVLAIARLRIHDDVLTSEQIQANYDAEIDEVCPPGPCFCSNCPDSDVAQGGTTYSRQLSFSSCPGSPIGSLSATSPAGASISAEGVLTYDIPAGSGSFDVTIVCDTDNVDGETEFTWEVDVVNEVQCELDGIELAGQLHVCLDAEDPTAGAGIWLNGALGSNFAILGGPFVEDIDGVTAVTFNGGGDAYQSLENAPAPLTEPNSTRSIEAWVYNPDIASEETILSWGRRGGPDGSNMSFNYGNHGNFGAVGHWGGGGPDLGWIDNSFTPGAPAPLEWHHLVYTYDGETTRVYSDGVPMNSEFLGAGVIDTHDDFPITLAQQIEGGNIGPAGLAGTLSISQVRVMDGVLSDDQILDNFIEECPRYRGDCPESRDCIVSPEFTNEPELEQYCSQAEEYSYQLEFVGTPRPTLTVLSPDGGTVTEDGFFSYTLPDPAPDAFEVEIEAESGCQETGVATWTVERIDVAVGDGLQIAGDLFVDLDVNDLLGGDGPLGPWPNNGDLDDFNPVGDPQIVARGLASAFGVSFNEDGRSGDSYQSAESDPFVPEGLLGPDPTRTIEVWVFNPDFPGEETVLSWGKRGGPDGSNMSFNYGNHGNFGAVGHWGGGGPDLGWIDNSFTAGAPAADRWHHLAYTYDGETTRVYADGQLWNEEFLGFGVINTHADARISLAQQVEPDGVTLTTGNQGRLALARVRIHDEVLSPCQILVNWQLERPDFTPAPCPTGAGEADFEDTHIATFAVEPTGAFFGATHRATVSATDDTGDVISYAVTAENDVDPPTTVTASGLSGVELEIELFLDNSPDWTFTLVVDDRPDCDDAAPDSTLVLGETPPENCTNGTDDDGDDLADCEDPDCEGRPGCVEICDNSQDDDGDGAIDCADDDCRDDEEACPSGGFVRGDSNSSGIIDLTDGVVTLSFLFTGGPAPDCMDSADTDGNNQLVISDAVITFSYLFTGGPPPVPPSPSATSYAPEDCGPDPDDDALLDCVRPAAKCE